MLLMCVAIFATANVDDNGECTTVSVQRRVYNGEYTTIYSRRVVFVAVLVVTLLMMTGYDTVRQRQEIC